MVNKLFRLAIVQDHHNGVMLRLAVMICILGCLQTDYAFACRYNVRETGFVDLRIEPYYLFGYIRDVTGAEVVSRFKQVAEVGLENSNIDFEIINIDHHKDHPAMKLLDLQQVKSLPTAVLVSPDGQTYPISLAEHERPFEETVRSALENILSSPKRDEILRQVIKTYGVVLLIEGTDVQENTRAKKAASDAIELISSQMEMMPKTIAHPPVLIVMNQESLSDEEILLWSMGLDGKKLSEPHAAVLYGRSRWMGPMFKGEEIDEENLASVLFVIGADCECGFDYRWLQGTMLPARWTDKMQEQVAENLGFDPENPMIKMEISSIIRRGSYSYPGVPFGYQELVVEPDSNTGIDQNSFNEVEDITIPEPNQVEPVADNNPLTESNSPLRNTIFLLVGLCILVLTSGIVILIRAKKT
ncbi:MAG: hypothetical protein GWN67_09705 [Phycisphaerae bacterium]|nr:hypothetical protein [Phycisphaerae bacterium]NIP52365.1 hypothetical protein [Phycisphaerae bacterium]NIS51356.1 hypothetical protein [Phycisphaerae bacterium]NIU08968.1 hypothetical protein [Phycisphaerae bacterium]NIU56637.1 hypothetical protein [Phycisphaerae bacterium]